MILVLVGEDDGGDALRLDGDGTHPSLELAARETGVQKQACARGFDDDGIAGATGTQDAHSHRGKQFSEGELHNDNLSRVHNRVAGPRPQCGTARPN